MLLEAETALPHSSFDARTLLEQKAAVLPDNRLRAQAVFPGSCAGTRTHSNTPNFGRPRLSPVPDSSFSTHAALWQRPHVLPESRLTTGKRLFQPMKYQPP